MFKKILFVGLLSASSLQFCGAMNQTNKPQHWVVDDQANNPCNDGNKWEKVYIPCAGCRELKVCGERCDGTKGCFQFFQPLNLPKKAELRRLFSEFGLAWFANNTYIIDELINAEYIEDVFWVEFKALVDYPEWGRDENEKKLDLLLCKIIGFPSFDEYETAKDFTWVLKLQKYLK